VVTYDKGPKPKGIKGGCREGDDMQPQCEERERESEREREREGEEEEVCVCVN
jgi:hypothetical protein